MKFGIPKGDLWGGLSAMLVAVPAAIAFGVTAFAPLGSTFAAQGALAGVWGAAVLGLLAPAVGGTKGLISAPCAPAAAILSAFTIEASARGMPPEAVLIQIALVCMMAGTLQLTFGLLGVGRVIRYMPYPVVSGYLTGVGLIIILSQIPKLLGAPSGMSWWHAFASPGDWQWTAIGLGGATLAAMWLAPRWTEAVPATILGLVVGVVAYFGFALWHPELLTLDHNTLVVGRLPGSTAVLLAGQSVRWQAFTALALDDMTQVLVPSATLAILLSIDTLKTCVVLDALTRGRHDPNRELIGQGVANLMAGATGAMPGAGTMGPTLVNLSSGAQTRASSLVAGALALLALLLFAPLIGWIPIAALSAILILVGVRMMDWASFAFLRNRSTVLDFAVVAAVVAVALAYSLIAASGVGVALAVLLFVREQIGSSVVHRRSSGHDISSKRVRLPKQMARLRERGDETAVIELQGSLFFGTADQLYNAVEPEIGQRRFVVLDFQRVQSVDITVAHLLEQIEDRLAERHAVLCFSGLPRSLPSGRDIHRYFGEVGLVRTEHRAHVFEELDAALESIEERILAEEHLDRAEESPLELREIDLFAGRKEETLVALEACMQRRSYPVGSRIFSVGETSDELFLIRTGAVRVVLPIAGREPHHLATFGRADFFGEMSFLDSEPRSADAIAFTEVELFALSRQRFEEIAAEHKALAMQLLGGLARVLAIRLRYTNAEMRALRSPGGPTAG